jgi:hypothetical protein
MASLRGGGPPAVDDRSARSAVSVLPAIRMSTSSGVGRVVVQRGSDLGGGAPGDGTQFAAQDIAVPAGFLVAQRVQRRGDLSNVRAVEQRRTRPRRSTPYDDAGMLTGVTACGRGVRARRTARCRGPVAFWICRP